MTQDPKLKRSVVQFLQEHPFKTDESAPTQQTNTTLAPEILQLFPLPLANFSGQYFGNREIALAVIDMGNLTEHTNLRNALTTLGVKEVKRATSGQELLDILQIGKPDLMIFKAQLADMNFLKLLQMTREHPKLHHVKKMVVIAANQTTNLTKAFALGLDGYLIPPLNAKNICQRLHAMMIQNKMAEVAPHSKSTVLAAYAYYELQDFVQATHLVKKAIDQWPTEGIAHLYQAMILQHQGNISDADNSYAQAIKTLPEMAPMVTRLRKIAEKSSVEDVESAAQGKETTLEDSALEDFALEDSALKDSALEDSALEDSALEDSALEDSALEDSALEDSALKATSTNKAAPNQIINPTSSNLYLEKPAKKTNPKAPDISSGIKYKNSNRIEYAELFDDSDEPSAREDSVFTLKTDLANDSAVMATLGTTYQKNRSVIDQETLLSPYPEELLPQAEPEGTINGISRVEYAELFDDSISPEKQSQLLTAFPETMLPEEGLEKMNPIEGANRIEYTELFEDNINAQASNPTDIGISGVAVEKSSVGASKKFLQVSQIKYADSKHQSSISLKPGSKQAADLALGINDACHEQPLGFEQIVGALPVIMRSPEGEISLLPGGTIREWIDPAILSQLLFPTPTSTKQTILDIQQGQQKQHWNKETKRTLKNLALLLRQAQLFNSRIINQTDLQSPVFLESYLSTLAACFVREDILPYLRFKPEAIPNEIKKLFHIVTNKVTDMDSAIKLGQKLIETGFFDAYVNQFENLLTGKTPYGDPDRTHPKKILVMLRLGLTLKQAILNLHKEYAWHNLGYKHILGEQLDLAVNPPENTAYNRLNRLFSKDFGSFEAFKQIIAGGQERGWQPAFELFYQKHAKKFLQDDLFRPTLAKFLLAKGLNEKALEVLENGSAQEKTQVEYLKRTAVTAFRAGNMKNAVKWCKNILKIDVSTEEAYNLLGVISKNQNRLDAAIRYYQQGIAYQPNSRKLHFNLAIALDTIGEKEEAHNVMLTAKKL